jgi:hypothetical protein
LPYVYGKHSFIPLGFLSWGFSVNLEINGNDTGDSFDKTSDYNFSLI